MTTEQILGLAIALGIMVIGLAGTLLPALPSTPIVLVAAIGHRLYFGTESVGNVALTLLVVFALLALALDYFATVLGAKKLGATWRGAAGAVIGVVVGLFFGPPGIILGPFLGALAGEMAGGREFEEAARAGMGAVIGLFVGAVGKFACCLVMIGLFTFSVVRNSSAPSVTLEAVAGLAVMRSGPPTA